MAAISGTTAALAFSSGYTSNAFKWDADITGEKLDVTPLGSTWQTITTGLLRMTGTYECYIDATTTLPLAGVTGAATFTANTSRTYSGNIIITGVKIGVSADGSSRTATFSFDSTGAITPA